MVDMRSQSNKNSLDYCMAINEITSSLGMESARQSFKSIDWLNEPNMS